MAKKQKIVQTTKSSGLKITHPDTAGIDVGSTGKCKISDLFEEFYFWR